MTTHHLCNHDYHLRSLSRLTVVMSGRTNRGRDQKYHSEFPLVLDRQADHLQERGDT
jgi:hypothetical protein